MESVILNTAEGRVSGFCHDSGKADAPYALVLPHHPENGGSAISKLTQTLCKAFIENDFNVFTFDYPGIGLSQGSFQNNEQIVKTAAYIFDLFTSELSPRSYKVLSGVSFGAWVAMQILMRRPGVDNFFVASLPISKYDFSFLSPCPISGHFILGTKDILIDNNKFVEFIKNVEENSEIKLKSFFIEDAEHLYTNHMTELQNLISNELKKDLVKNLMAI